MEPDTLVPVLRHIVPLTHCVTLTVTREVRLRLTDRRWGGCYVALFSLHLRLHTAIRGVCVDFVYLFVDSFGPNVRETLRMKLPTVLKLCLCLFCHTLWPLSGPVI